MQDGSTLATERASPARSGGGGDDDDDDAPVSADTGSAEGTAPSAAADDAGSAIADDGGSFLDRHADVSDFDARGDDGVDDNVREEGDVEEYRPVRSPPALRGRTSSDPSRMSSASDYRISDSVMLQTPPSGRASERGTPRGVEIGGVGSAVALGPSKLRVGHGPTKVSPDPPQPDYPIEASDFTATTDFTAAGSGEALSSAVRSVVPASARWDPGLVSHDALAGLAKFVHDAHVRLDEFFGAIARRNAVSASSEEMRDALAALDIPLLQSELDALVAQIRRGPDGNVTLVSLKYCLDEHHDAWHAWQRDHEPSYPSQPTSPARSPASLRKQRPRASVSGRNSRSPTSPLSPSARGSVPSVRDDDDEAAGLVDALRQQLDAATRARQEDKLAHSAKLLELCAEYDQTITTLQATSEIQEATVARLEADLASAAAALRDAEPELQRVRNELADAVLAKETSTGFLMGECQELKEVINRLTLELAAAHEQATAASTAAAAQVDAAQQAAAAAEAAHRAEVARLEQQSADEKKKLDRGIELLDEELEETRAAVDAERRAREAAEAAVRAATMASANAVADAVAKAKSDAVAPIGELEGLLNAARAEGDELREKSAQVEAQVAAITRERDEARSHIAAVQRQAEQLAARYEEIAASQRSALEVAQRQVNESSELLAAAAAAEQAKAVECERLGQTVARMQEELERAQERVVASEAVADVATNASAAPFKADLERLEALAGDKRVSVEEDAYLVDSLMPGSARRQLSTSPDNVRGAARAEMESFEDAVASGVDALVEPLKARVSELEALLNAAEAERNVLLSSAAEERDRLWQQAEAAAVAAAEAEAMAISAGQDAVVPLNARVSELELLLGAAKAEGDELREKSTQVEAQVAAVTRERDEARSQVADVQQLTARYDDIVEGHVATLEEVQRQLDDGREALAASRAAEQAKATECEDLASTLADLREELVQRASEHEAALASAESAKSSAESAAASYTEQVPNPLSPLPRCYCG
jgi:hypothetical protein